MQLVTARFLGTFQADPLDVPQIAIDYLAGQLDARDPSCLKRYGDRAKTRLEHVWEIRRALRLVEFAEARPNLETWAEQRHGQLATARRLCSWKRSHGYAPGTCSYLAFRYWHDLSPAFVTKQPSGCRTPLPAH